MSEKYHIYAYKHYWPKHLDDPDNMDIPMPYRSDDREFVIEAKNEKQAIKLAEKEYGSGERADANGTYLLNPDGSWTIMGVSKVELLTSKDSEAKAEK